MKTYSRRKIEHRLIENVHEFCRLCLQNTRDLETVALFTNENVVYPPLTTKIMICTGLELANEECLPNVICTECNNKINSFYTFRKRCGIAYQVFRSHTLATKEIINNTSQAQNEQQIVIASECHEDQILLTFVEDKPLMVNTSEEIPSGDFKEIENGIQHDGALPEISDFLKNVFLELGIIRKNDDNCLQSDFLGSTIEMETADGWQMTLQLSEVENEETPIRTVEQTCDSTQDPVPVVEDKKERKNVPPMCSVCGKTFTSRGVLLRHARTHSGERPYACRSCPRHFTQAEVLRRHELVHLEKRPFACDLCPKSFTQRGALTAHQRSHAPPAARPLALHRCIACPKFFLHASGLSRHMRAHLAQPQARCDVCGRTFSSRDSLQRHVARTHTDKTKTPKDSMPTNLNETDIKPTDVNKTEEPQTCILPDIK